MKTDDLIAALAADQRSVSPPVGRVLAVALAAALPISLLLFAVTLGPRGDIASAWSNSFFSFKFVVTLSLLAAAAAVALRLSRPEVKAGRFLYLLAVPAVVLMLGIMADFAWWRTEATAWTARLVGTNARVCLVAIPALSLPLLAAALFGLRHGATSEPVLAGGIAGMLAAALAATLYATHCTDDSPLFVATWYTLAIALVALIGALAGRRILRF
jgi:hypothetical protein